MVFYCKVQEHIGGLVTEHFNDDVEVVMRDPILFGDFRMALHEEETRIYEDIQDYEAAKALFQVRWGSFLRRALLAGAEFRVGDREVALGRTPALLPPGSERELVSPSSGSHVPRCVGTT